MMLSWIVLGGSCLLALELTDQAAAEIARKALQEMRSVELGPFIVEDTYFDIVRKLDSSKLADELSAEGLEAMRALSRDHARAISNFYAKYIDYLAERKRWTEIQLLLSNWRSDLVFWKLQDSDLFLMALRAEAVLEPVRAFEDALSFEERRFGTVSEAALRATRELSSAYSRAGEHEKAVQVARKGLALAEQLYGPEHGDWLGLRASLARLELRVGNTASARYLYDLAVRSPDYSCFGGARHSLLAEIAALP